MNEIILLELTKEESELLSKNLKKSISNVKENNAKRKLEQYETTINEIIAELEEKNVHESDLPITIEINTDKDSAINIAIHSLHREINESQYYKEVVVNILKKLGYSDLKINEIFK